MLLCAYLCAWTCAGVWCYGYGCVSTSVYFYKCVFLYIIPLGCWGVFLMWAQFEHAYVPVCASVCVCVCVCVCTPVFVCILQG